MNGEIVGIDPGGEMSGVSYDPFSGMSPSAIAGGPAKHFPVEAYTPEPDWLTRMWQPVDYLWETGEQFAERTAEKLPELLWGYGLSKLRKVDEGAGVTVIHSQAPQPGGTPARPIPTTIPFYTPMAGAPPQAVGTSMMILIGAGIFLIYILSR